MEGRNRWGWRGKNGTPGGCKEGILQGVQKCTSPGATTDKTNGNKMLPQGRTAGGRDEITATSIKTLMAIAWVGIQIPHKISYTKEETSPEGLQGRPPSLKERSQGALGRSFRYRSFGM